MAKSEKKKTRRFLRLDPKDYGIIYRMIITSSPEGVSGVRTTNDLLNLFEAEGDPRAQTPDEVANDVPVLYEAGEEVCIFLSTSEQNALKKQIGDGVKRFQSWVVRTMPAVLDRLQELESEETPEAEGEVTMEE